MNDYLRKRHSVTKLTAHLVFTTKYRRKLLTAAMIEQIRDAVNHAAKRLEIDLVELDGEADHIHLLIHYPPKLAISVIVNNLKSITSRMVRQHNTHLPTLSKNGALWSRSYFACSCGGAPLEVIKQYVQQQSTPH